MPCLKYSIMLRMKTEPDTVETDATVYVWFLSDMPDIFKQKQVVDFSRFLLIEKLLSVILLFMQP